MASLLLKVNTETLLIFVPLAHSLCLSSSLCLCPCASAAELPSFLYVPGVMCFFASSLQQHHFLYGPVFFSLSLRCSCCLVPDSPPSVPPPPASCLSLTLTFFLLLPLPSGPPHVIGNHAKTYPFVTFCVLLSIQSVSLSIFESCVSSFPAWCTLSGFQSVPCFSPSRMCWCVSVCLALSVPVLTWIWLLI